jgi:hypothetical protein
VIASPSASAAAMVVKTGVRNRKGAKAEALWFATSQNHAI